ncbi:hypothetical protein COCMIDRAFT_41289 [Bipolaris oryzae ATCC 44560]|uniref:Heme haloperoxidase family profile domain-containing protein n=1 Tax=Bipolaris oryzae ATCC 44560 TaxID=930090 RepID=W6Z9J6_COCMI|nr:uncharacterized protein COCMIDRAFT_41289 [Bipolaris oryzae ATCC 44560]EUC40366.1 hypothetical protein COCMIDRAFT_41289 [Bipolaris oryzae ATCC 44560]
MRFAPTVALALPAIAAAYPGKMGPTSRAEMEQQLLAQMESEDLAKRAAEPQLLKPVGNLLGSLGDLVDGLLTSVGQAVVKKSNRHPEPGFEFKAPGPNDSHGPYPGLNLLANYGYLPRDGYVNFGQVLGTTARGFNIRVDLATVLATFAVWGGGDLDGISFYLGSGKDGIADVSPNREDCYNSCGENHYISSRLVKRMVGFATKDPKKELSMNENWYRRDTPYGVVQTIADGFLAVYPRSIIVPGAAQVGTPNLSVQTVLYDMYQDLNSIAPLALGDTGENVAKRVSWALLVLDLLLSKTALGCPDRVISLNFLFPGSQKEGGPVNLPRVLSDRWIGNNVYGKVYFVSNKVRVEAMCPSAPTCGEW